jgi:hypothetical protein
MQSFFANGPLTVDTARAQKFFDEEDNSILDDHILDHSAIDSGLELSPPMDDSRRESFAVGPPLFPTKTEDWQSVDMQSVPSNNPFLEQTSNNPFMRLHQNAPNPFVAHGNGWPMNQGSTSTNGSPLQQFDAAPSDYDGGASVFQRSMTMQTPFTNPSNPFASLGAGNQSIPTSPQKDWGHHLNGKHMRPGSPAIRSHNELRRGDGIRKKNARFDIPAERNLSNIDHLIAQSTDEQEIKELKQQKRLLRNRQAALDSRQRKKQHTERLEDEKKQFNILVTGMEEEVADLKTQMEQLMREKQSYAEYIDRLTLEKDEMIRAHTVETGDLRKKVGVLTDHIRRYENGTMATETAAPSSFQNSFGDIDDLSMSGTWDNSNFLNDFAAEPEVKQELAVVPVKQHEQQQQQPTSHDGEKNSAQGGLLFMLFLVGAFVMSSRSTPAIPRVSEDIRAASASILNSVLKDAGVPSQSNGVQAVAQQPQPSTVSWSNPAPSMHAMNDAGRSSLSDLGDRLTQPTEQQANEQLFSLSPSQYNGVNDQTFLENAPERGTSQGRKNLAEALAAMRTTDKQNGVADVYTRSLLWDQIPNDVVRNFAKMVAESNKAQNDAQQRNDAIS